MKYVIAVLLALSIALAALRIYQRNVINKQIDQVEAELKKLVQRNDSLKKVLRLSQIQNVWYEHVLDSVSNKLDSARTRTTKARHEITIVPDSVLLRDLGIIVDSVRARHH